MTKKPLTQKVALITGAARRIGAEIARILHESGLNVVLHYNASEDEAVKLCDELNDERKNSAVAIQVNLSEVESLENLVDSAAKKWGRLDVLVNNASRFYRTDVGSVTDFAWEDLLTSNLKAPFFLSQSAAPHLKKHNGCIVNITDIHADRPMKDYSVYCISKGGLAMMTKVLARELGPEIRVNAVAPGAILWPEGENTIHEKDKATIIKRTALHKPGEPEDIAKAVLYLVKDGQYVTGQVINVDGGRTLFT